jgi:hypothetical protein
MTMSTTLEQIMERYTQDPAFKAQLRADPEAAAKAAGIALDDEDRQALRGLDFSLSDEQLQQRVSKGHFHR